MYEDVAKEIEKFIVSLEVSLNSHDAVEYNKYFDKYISWGNPNGGLSNNLSEVHSVHKNFLEGELKDSKFKYTAERIEAVTTDCAYAHVRLTRTNKASKDIESDERCLYLFVRRDGVWWLCAGHNTRIKPPEKNA